MIKAGQYIIQYYNRVGTKIKDLTGPSDTYTNSKEMGEETIALAEEGEDVKPTSFTVDRRLYNSMDKF